MARGETSVKGRGLARFLRWAGIVLLALAIAGGVGLVVGTAGDRCLDLGSIGGGVICDDTGSVAPALVGVGLTSLGLVAWGVLRALALTLEHTVELRERDVASRGAARTEATVILPSLEPSATALPPSPSVDGSGRFSVVVDGTGPSLSDLATRVARELRKDPAYVRGVLDRMPAVVVRDVDHATALRVLGAVRWARGSGRIVPAGGRVESPRLNA